MNEHYVYIHLNPRTNEIFYVGKGKGFRKSSKSGRNEKWSEYVAKLEEPFKVLVVRENLSQKAALELERKIIAKIDWHYDDSTTNMTDSFSAVENVPTIQFTFGGTPQSNEYIPQIRFQNLSDKEIIFNLLSFPNEFEINKLSSEFEKVCVYFHDNWDELEEGDEDIFLDIEGVIDSIEDLLSKYKTSDKNNISELITDLKREKLEIEIIQECGPKDKQRKILDDITKWIEDIVEK